MRGLAIPQHNYTDCVASPQKKTRRLRLGVLEGSYLGQIFHENKHKRGSKSNEQVFLPPFIPTIWTISEILNVRAEMREGGNRLWYVMAMVVSPQSSAISENGESS